MERKALSKGKRILLGITLLLLTAAALFFSTPWLGETAPSYLPMPGIQLELNTTPSHFMHTLSVTAHNADGRQTQFCAPYPKLEYYDNGEWRSLQDIFPVYTLAYLEGIDPGQSKALTAKSSVYGYFLRGGHYRAVVLGDKPQEAAWIEFDI